MGKTKKYMERNLFYLTNSELQFQLRLFKSNLNVTQNCQLPSFEAQVHQHNKRLSAKPYFFDKIS